MQCNTFFHRSCRWVNNFKAPVNELKVRYAWTKSFGFLPHIWNTILFWLTETDCIWREFFGKRFQFKKNLEFQSGFAGFWKDIKHREHVNWLILWQCMSCAIAKWFEHSGDTPNVYRESLMLICRGDLFRTKLGT